MVSVAAASGHIPGVNLWLVMQNEVQQGTVNFNMAVVVNKAQLPKFVHKKANPRSRRADHLRQRFLADFRNDWLGPSLLAKIRKKQTCSKSRYIYHKLGKLPVSEIAHEYF